MKVKQLIKELIRLDRDGDADVKLALPSSEPSVTKVSDGSELRTVGELISLLEALDSSTLVLFTGVTGRLGGVRKITAEENHILISTDAQ